MEPEQTNLSFEQLLGIFRRRAPWIVLCFVLITAAAYGYSKHKTKKYTATTAITFNSNPLSQQVAGLSTGSSNNLVAQQDSNLELVKLGDTAAKTASLLGHGLTDEEVSESVSVGVKGETDIVEVSATSASPALAAATANTYARQFVKEQQTANRKLFESALRLVNRQLAKLSKEQRVGPDGLELQDRAHTLVLLTELGYNNAEVAGKAPIPTSPSSPKTKKNTLLGMIVGLVLGLGLAFLLERLDRRIREPEELERIYRLPMLGVVPKSAALSAEGTALPAAEAEAFNLIRAHLRFFNIDRDLCTVLIASPAQGDGKTTIARHLAEAAARFGLRVLLLELDLRRPTLAAQLGAQSGPGLAEVLIGAVPMDQATQSIDLQTPFGEGARGHTLEVLTAGAVLPPNPGELLESRAMNDLLERVKSMYDLVVVDTPPLTAVSDAFPLLTKVDGVVIVGRIGYSRRDSAEQLQQVLASSGAPLLGVVANGSKSGAPNPYPGVGPSPPAVASADNASSSDELAPTAKA